MHSSKIYIFFGDNIEGMCINQFKYSFKHHMVAIIIQQIINETRRIPQRNCTVTTSIGVGGVMQCEYDWMMIIACVHNPKESQRLIKFEIAIVVFV